MIGLSGAAQFMERLNVVVLVRLPEVPATVIV